MLLGLNMCWAPCEESREQEALQLTASEDSLRHDDNCNSGIHTSEESDCARLVRHVSSISFASINAVTSAIRSFYFVWLRVRVSREERRVLFFSSGENKWSTIEQLFRLNCAAKVYWLLPSFLSLDTGSSWKVRILLLLGRCEKSAKDKR